MTPDILIEVRLKTLAARGANADHLALLACEDIRNGLRFGKLPIEGVRVEVVTKSPQRAIDQEWIQRYVETLRAYAERNKMDPDHLYRIEAALDRAEFVEDMVKAWKLHLKGVE